MYISHIWCPPFQLYQEVCVLVSKPNSVKALQTSRHGAAHLASSYSSSLLHTCYSY
jgi:hypothetical protein